jgi:hypothetical protein
LTEASCAGSIPMGASSGGPGPDLSRAFGWPLREGYLDSRYRRHPAARLHRHKGNRGRA